MSGDDLLVVAAAILRERKMLRPPAPRLADVRLRVIREPYLKLTVPEPVTFPYWATGFAF